MSQATLQHPAPTSPGERSGVPTVAVPFAAIVLAMLPAVLDQTILATALPVVAGDLGSLTDVSWVVTAYVVAAAASTPMWGKLGDRIGRKLLLEVALLVFVARLGAVRRGAGHHAAHRPARRPGRGRRRPHDAGDGRRRRPRRPARARALPGLHRGDLRRGDHRRPAHRRRPRRPRELALGLPRQPAARRRRPRRPAPAPAGAGGRGRRPPARRGGRRAPGRRDHRPDADLHLGRLALRLGLGRHPRPDRRDRRPVRRAGRARAPRRGPDRPLPPAAHRPGGHRQRRAVPRDRRAVLGHRLRPALPGDDDRAPARPRPGCCWSRPCSASRSRPRCRAARSCAPGATSASRSPGWRS